jgi:hypothetical protein
LSFDLRDEEPWRALYKSGDFAHDVALLQSVETPANRAEREPSV